MGPERRPSWPTEGVRRSRPDTDPIRDETRAEMAQRSWMPRGSNDAAQRRGRAEGHVTNGRKTYHRRRNRSHYGAAPDAGLRRGTIPGRTPELTMMTSVPIYSIVHGPSSDRVEKIIGMGPGVGLRLAHSHCTGTRVDPTGVRFVVFFFFAPLSSTQLPIMERPPDSVSIFTMENT